LDWPGLRLGPFFEEKKNKKKSKNKKGKRKKQ